MKQRTIRPIRSVALAWVLIFFTGAGFRVLADCASFDLPFTDLGSTGFCAAIAEAYYAGITNGTSATTFSPNANVTRAQTAAFATRTLDAALTRGSRRAALGQWWTTTSHYDLGLGLTSTGSDPTFLKSDGSDIWVADEVNGTVSRVRASDGKKLDEWTGATGAYGVLVAMGRVFVTSSTSPGKLYVLDPTAPAGGVTTLASTLGNGPRAVAFDGNKIWTANSGDTNGDGVSIITPGSTTPWSVTTVTSGFTEAFGIVYDGNNIWVTDFAEGTLLRLDASGTVMQTVVVGTNPAYPTFDGHNIWVPNQGSDSLTIVRASDGAVMKTFSGIGLNIPTQAAFDGQRILVTNQGGELSLFNATDLSIIGNVTVPGVDGAPFGVCSDGINFWVSSAVSGTIARF